jgi:hypothetical protein
LMTGLDRPRNLTLFYFLSLEVRETL